MSRLRELIEELCPEGVEHMKLGNFAECFSGATPKKSHPEYWDGGTIPWMSSGEVHQHVVRQVGGRITQAGYDSCSTRLIPAGTVVVALAGQGKTRGTVAITDIELCTNQSIGAILCSNIVDSKYLYYYLSGEYDYLRRISSGEGTRGGLNMPLLRDLDIPVPPIEVQREIVRILDSFQELDDALTAEIEARERQIEYYRDELLGSRLSSLCSDGVAYRALSELFDIRNGYTPSKKNPAFWDGGTHPWFVMEDIRRDGTVLNDSSAHITDDAIKTGLFPANSIIVATSATIGVHALVTVDFLCNQRFACMTVKERYADILDVRYAYQAFFALDRWCLEHVDQGNFATVNSAALRGYRIPVPPIEVQREIVSKLDAFQSHLDAMITERGARHKQFEHYRNRLLSFPKKVSS